ncbi:aldo-keto reductase family 1 member B1-like [Leptopilina heterotoma]|uniref:aldo-keto reductase family 1 member B1-like n=1 Tax=Leptopilina heterotoma TaxID=63436 RepID=UPI001CA86B9B|nr:aldo-keto reductase family 1 member B1-like [Leptopilina heterotoma]
MANVPFSRKLWNSKKIPALGLGTNAGFLYDPELTEHAVAAAIDIGYRLFDCSPIYMNEKNIGKAIQAKIYEKVVKRKDLFIVTKFWITNHKSMNVSDSLTSSLKALKLDYVDLFLMTWPFSHSNDVDYTNVWIEMENCIHKKMTKSIGVCNFNLEQLTRLQQFATIKPAVIQVECHINLNQTELRDYCKRNEIILMGYTPFGDVHEATDGPYSEWRTSEQVTLDAPEMKAIAEKYKKTVYQVALRYLTQIGVVPIPKSCSLMHIESNIEIFDFQLTQEEILIIDRLDCNKRIHTANQYRAHDYYPFY